MQQKAQRLSLEQQVIQDEVLKRKEILRNEDRWHRDSRRSLSDKSPRHRASSSTDIDDSVGDRLYSNDCELHMSSEELYFTNIGRKIRRGGCLGEPKHFVFCQYLGPD